MPYHTGLLSNQCLKFAVFKIYKTETSIFQFTRLQQNAHAFSCNLNPSILPWLMYMSLLSILYLLLCWNTTHAKCQEISVDHTYFLQNCVLKNFQTKLIYNRINNPSSLSLSFYKYTWVTYGCTDRQITSSYHMSFSSFRISRQAGLQTSLSVAHNWGS